MLKKSIKILIIILVSIYGFIYIFSREIQALITFPWVFINTLEYTQKYNSDTIQLDFKTIDIIFEWSNIQGLWLDNKSEKTVYYFHGSWWDLSFFYNDIQKISSLWVNVMAVEYPGYWKTDGFPYEDQIISRSEKFLEYMIWEYQLDRGDIVLLGYSAWTGIALELAKKKNFEKIILLSSYVSRYDLMQADIWIAWQKYVFLPNSLIAEEILQKIDASMLIIHGSKDDIIDIQQSEKLYSMTHKEKTSFIVFPEWNHYNLLEKEEKLKKISQFIWK